MHYVNTAPLQWLAIDVIWVQQDSKSSFGEVNLRVYGWKFDIHGHDSGAIKAEFATIRMAVYLSE